MYKVERCSAKHIKKEPRMKATQKAERIIKEARETGESRISSGVDLYSQEEALELQENWDEQDEMKSFDLTRYGYWIVADGCAMPLGIDTPEELVDKCGLEDDTIEKYSEGDMVWLIDQQEIADVKVHNGVKILVTASNQDQNVDDLDWLCNNDWTPVD